MTEEYPSPLNIFIGYAWEDRKYAETLEKYMSRLKQLDLTIWHLEEVRAGEKRKVAVDDVFNRASLILLLISADFFASSLYDELMYQDRKRYNQRKALVIPILLRPIDWHTVPFADSYVLPRNGKPIILWRNQGEAFSNVIEGIQEYLSEGIPFSKLRQPNSKLRKARLQRGWSQTALAKKINANPVSISRWEGGESSPSFYHCQRLSEVFGKDANELGLMVLPQEPMGSSLVREQRASSPEKMGSSFIREQAVPYEVSPRSLSKGKSAYHQSLGRVLLTLGQYEHALLTYERVLLHEPHNTTFLLGRGEALLGLKRSQEALTVYEQVLHLDPASSRAYEGQGKVYELIARQVLESMKRESQECFEKAKQLEVGYPETTRGVNNLVALYEAQGKYEEAEPLYQRALEICEQELGPRHPSTAMSLNDLAGLYQSQGRYTEAEPLYQRALEIWEQELGGNHPSTALSLNNLAVLYQDQGRYAEAEPFMKRVLVIWEQELGGSHPDTVRSLNNLAGLYYAQGRYAEAEPLYARALEIKEQSLGPTHPSTRMGRDNYAGLLRELGREEEAAALEGENERERSSMAAEILPPEDLAL